MTIKYTKATFVEKIRVKRWQAFFQAVPVDDLHDAQDHKSIADGLASAVTASRLSTEAHARLQMVVDLCPPRAFTALLPLLAEARVANLPEDVGNEEFVLELVLREDAASAEALQRAAILAREFGSRNRYRDFLGRARRAPSLTPEALTRLTDGIKAHCNGEANLGDHVEVRTVQQNHGDFILEVIHSNRLKSDIQAVGSGREPLRYRPVVGDILHYVEAHGLLRISATPLSLVPIYREQVGQYLFGDREFFPDAGPYTLEPLRRGPTVLSDHDVSQVYDVSLRMIEWEKAGAKFRVTVDEGSCFERMHDWKNDLKDADLLKAKLSMKVAEFKAPVSCTIEPPHRAPVRDNARRVVEAYLRDVGLRGHGTRAEEVTLWGQVGAPKRREQWLAVFGRKDFEGLVELRVFRKGRIRTIPDDRGGILRVVADGDGRFVAHSEDAAVSPRSLEATDVEGWHLREDEYAIEVGRRLGCSGEISALEDGVFDLGERALGDEHCRVWFAVRRPPQQALERLERQISAVLLVPATAEARPRVVPCDVMPTWAAVRRRVVEELGLEQSVPAIERARPDTVLVADRTRQLVWFRGNPVDLAAGSLAYLYVEALAGAKGEAIATSAVLGKHKTGSGDPTQPARKAKSTSLAKLKAANPQGEAWVDPFVAAGKGMVRCRVAAEVL